MTHTAFTPSPTAGSNADFSDLLFSGDDDEDVVMSPATDIFSGGGGGLFDPDREDDDPAKGELSFDEPLVKGISVIVLSSLEGVCCAKVGTTGSKMCFRQDTDAGSCPVSHSKQKCLLELSHPTLFRVDGGATSTTLLLDPCLSTIGIGASDIQNMLFTTFSEDEWAEEVLTFEGAEAAQTQIKEFRKTVSFERRNLAVPHSVKKKIAKNRNMQSPGLDLLAKAKCDVVRSSQARVTNVAATALPNAVLYSDPDSKAFIDAAEVRTKYVTELSLYTSDRVEKKCAQMEAATDEVVSSLLVSKLDLKAVAAKVGSKPSTGFLSGLTLWQSVEKLVNIGESTGIMQLEAKGISLATGTYIDSVLRSGTTLHNLLASYKKQLEILKNNVQKLMTGSPGSVGLGLHNGPAPALSMAFSAPNSPPTGDLIQRMEARIAFLEKQSTARQTVGNSMTVQFEGQLFNCQQDMENYVSRLIQSSAVPPSLVNDCYTLLHAIVLSLQTDHIGIREIHSINQMGSNINEADVQNAIAGNQNSVPPFFKGTSKSSSLFTGDSGGAKHRLKGIPTYGFWGKPGSVEGFRYQALNQLDRIVASIQTDLSSKVQNSEMRGFLKAMLTRSSEFVRALFDYITNSYAELIETFTDSGQTWDFVCHCVEHIFSHEFNVARSILRGHDLKSQGFNERMLWTSLRTVVVQESFLAVGIANHSSLSGAYSKFLLKNSQSSEVAGMKRKLEKMDEKVEAVAAKVTKFDGRIKAAEGTANKAFEATKKKT